MTKVTEVEIPAEGATIAGRWARGDDALAGPAGRPCVVMAHGLGGTRDSGIDAFADGLTAGAGVDTLTFDYRGFGASGGQPRQIASAKRQRADYAAVVAYARGLDGVDPDRIVVWGTSFAGGIVLQVAAADRRIAGVVSLTPASDGLAALFSILGREGVMHGMKLTALGLRDAVGAVRGRPPLLAPIVAEPGTPAALTAPGALADYTALTGPTWRNEVAARFFLEVGLHRPVTSAAKVACPVLVQVADDDQSAPTDAQAKAGEKARAEVHHYPCDHFDVYPGTAWHEQVLAHQVAFLRRHFAADAATAAAVGATA